MGPDSDADPAIFVIDLQGAYKKKFCSKGPDPDPGDPKTYGSDGSGYATLVFTTQKFYYTKVMRNEKFFFLLDSNLDFSLFRVF
jgi:hypothetical protein